MAEYIQLLRVNFTAYREPTEGKTPFLKGFLLATVMIEVRIIVMLCFLPVVGACSYPPDRSREPTFKPQWGLNLADRGHLSSLDRDLYLAARLFWLKQYGLSAKAYLAALESLSDDQIRITPYQRESAKDIVFTGLTSVANALKNRKDYSEGQHILSKTLQYFSDDPLLNAIYAFFLHRLGRSETACGFYNKAIALGLLHGDLKNDYRLLLVEKQQYAEALEVWEQDVPTHLIFSEDNLFRDNYERLHRISLLAQGNIENIDMHIQLARAYEKVGWLQEAAREYEQATRLGSEFAQKEKRRVLAHINTLDAIENYFAAQQIGFRETGDCADVLTASMTVQDLIRREIPEWNYGPCVEGYGSIFRKRKEVPRSRHSENPLQRYFRRYGQFITLIKVSGEKLPIFDVQNILAWYPSKIYKLWDYEIPCEVIIGEDYSEASNNAMGAVFLSGQGFHINNTAVSRLAELLMRKCILMQRVAAGGSVEASMLSRLAQMCSSNRIALPWSIENRKNLFPKVYESLFSFVEYHEIGHMIGLHDPFVNNMELRANMIGLSQSKSPYFYFSLIFFDLQDNEARLELSKIKNYFFRHGQKHGEHLLDDSKTSPTLMILSEDDVRAIADEFCQKLGIPQRARKLEKKLKRNKATVAGKRSSRKG